MNSSGDNWNVGDSDAYDVDVQNIVAHEAGHWLVLSDLYADNNQDKTMYGVSGEKDLIKRSLASGDIAGIQTIYPIQTSVQNIMHVWSMTMTPSAGGANYFINTGVTVVDDKNTPVPAAVVYTDTVLPDGSKVSSNMETNNQGVATFKLKSKQTGLYTSTVTDITKEGWMYDSETIIETSLTIPVP